MLQTYVYCRANLKQTWQMPHLLPYLRTTVNMAANVAFTMSATDLL